MAGDPAPVDLPVRAVLLRGLYRVLVPVSGGRRVLRHATATPAARGAGGAGGGAHASQRVLAGAPVVVDGDEGDGAAGGAGAGRPSHPRRAGPARRRRDLLGVFVPAVRRCPGVDARPGRVGHAVVGPRSRARPGSHRGGSPAEGERSDRLRRRHRGVFPGSRVDRAGDSTPRRRVRTVDRRQHLSTRVGPPVHLARTVYVRPVPAIFLARVGRAATARGAFGGRVRGRPGRAGRVLLLVAPRRLTFFFCGDS